MADYDLHNNTLAVQALDPHTYSGDVLIESNIIDMSGFNALEFVTNIGAIDLDIVATTFTVTVVHGDESDLSDSTVVPDAFLLGFADASFTGVDELGVRRLGYVGKKRYVRYAVQPAGSTTAVFSVTALLLKPGSAPTDANT